MSRDDITSVTSPYGIYVHIPFCTSKCTYCDFLSFPGRQNHWKKRYIHALCREIESRIHTSWSQPESIFIGGGTPSVLGYLELETLLHTLTTSLELDGNEEFTLEANPASLNTEKLTLLRRYGVNRLSIGVQSMADDDLRRLGRCHRRSDVLAAVKKARAAGFENISLDLIYGLPGMTLAGWKATLMEALALAPNHLSLYQLQIEEGTALARYIASGLWQEPDEEMALAAWEMQIPLLRAYGYAQYEISNYAQPGFASRHNQLYWDLEDYLGLGLGAVGWVRPVRETNTTSLSHYCAAWEQGHFPERETETLNRATQQAEMVFMALRMNRGLSRARFEAVFGEEVEAAYGPVIEGFIEEGLLNRDDESVYLTDRGRLMGNRVFEGFL